jgi:rhamnogalacturonan endolyase
MKILFSAAFATCCLLPVTLSAAATAVVVNEEGSTYTLDNGIVRAQVAKRSGDLISLKYADIEMLSTGAGRWGGYWSHNAALGRIVTRVTIDPNANAGERGEVSVKGFYNGVPLGSGPGGSVVADIEIRYALGRGDSGLFTYSMFEHQTNHPATSIGEARFCLKLNDGVFDWMTVDAQRNMKLITAYDWNHGVVMNMKEARRMTSGLYNGQVEHKYDYSANQFDVRAWGWSSTTKSVGLWFVNPSVEYLSGGPTKFELSAHRDATFGSDPDAPAPPTLLNYWRSSHYGGAVCPIAQGEAWTKVIGPFLIYCNAGPNPDAMWKDALAKSEKESAAWPYDWVSGIDYPRKPQRGTVAGQIVLNDPQAPKAQMTRLLVGLAAPDYSPSRTGRDMVGFGGGGSRPVDWQNDAKHYQFWVLGGAEGRFAIPNIRPGTYTMHAIADGVLGELVMTNVLIASGQTLDLGKLNWQPVRFGKQLWDVGVPNRTGREFFKGDDYFHWGWYLEYPKLFPKDVNYVIGKSDFHRDWFFEQVPHNENPANTNGSGTGRSTTWSISFALPSAPRGKATLRLALCGIGARSLAVTVNEQPAGNVTGLMNNATVHRDGIGGNWSERDVVFDASLMRAGDNVMKLTIPAGTLTSGLIYDYLRLELNEFAAASNSAN